VVVGEVVVVEKEVGDGQWWLSVAPAATNSSGSYQRKYHIQVIHQTRAD